MFEGNNFYYGTGAAILVALILGFVGRYVGRNLPPLKQSLRTCQFALVGFWILSLVLGVSLPYRSLNTTSDLALIQIQIALNRTIEVLRLFSCFSRLF